jgi:hypothetical protein
LGVGVGGWGEQRACQRLAQCGAPIVQTGRGRARRYCDDCRHARHLEQKRRSNRATPKAKRGSRTRCQNCGRPVNTDPTRPGPPTRYCQAPECQRQATNRAQRRHTGRRARPRLDRFARSPKHREIAEALGLTVEEYVADMGAAIAAEAKAARYHAADPYRTLIPDHPLFCLSCRRIVGEWYGRQLMLFTEHLGARYRDGYQCEPCARAAAYMAMLREQRRVLLDVMFEIADERVLAA